MTTLANFYDMKPDGNARIIKVGGSKFSAVPADVLAAVAGVNLGSVIKVCAALDYLDSAVDDACPSDIFLYTADAPAISAYGTDRGNEIRPLLAATLECADRGLALALHLPDRVGRMK